MKKWKCKKSELILETKFFRVRKDVVELPTKETKEWFYEDSNDSVMVLGMTKDKKLVMLRQYRYLVDKGVIEFPAGGLHGNESTQEGARREFEEESGFRCASLIKLGSFYESYGCLNRQIHIFFAKNVTESRQKLDAGENGFEDIKVELIDFKKAVKLVLGNKIVATSSSLAILLLKEKSEGGKIKI